MSDNPAESAATMETDGDTLSAVLDKKNEQVPHEVLAAENLENSRIRYSVKVPSEAFAEKVDEVLKDLKGQVQVKGFRKGKAPMNLVRNQYIKHAREDAIRKIVPRLAELTAEEKGVEVLAQPVFEGWEEDADKNPVLKIVLEVRPEINITDETLKDIKIEVTESPVTDEVVEKQLQQIRESNATFEAIEGAVFAEGDGLTYSAEATENGRRLPNFSATEKYSQTVARELPEAVVKALVGKAKEDVVTVQGIELPPDPTTGLSATADFKVTIHEIKKRVLPELDDEFAKDVSEEFETLADLKAKVRENLTAREEERRRTETLNALFAVLRERLDFEIPFTLVERLANNSIGRMERQLNQYGLSLRRMGRDYVENYLTHAETEARVEAQNLLIVDQVGRFLGVEATDEAVDAEIARIAELQGRKPLAIRATLEKERRLDEFKAELRVKAINDKLISLAQITVVERKEEQEEQPAE